jgi:hypothetical protein
MTTAYFVPAGDDVKVKFYVEELSPTTLATTASVTVPTDEFHLWPMRYLSVDQKGRAWCMVAAKDRVSFRILTPSSGEPDVTAGALARSANATASSLACAIGDLMKPGDALADADPPARANP